MQDQCDNPIGIFDSGVGGLTVCKAIAERVPNENIVYFGDTARVPYGSKSGETIKRYSLENADFLMSFHAKILVVACNTSCAVSLSSLKERYNVPIVSVIDPAAKLAVQVTKAKKIGVIGTKRTIVSNAHSTIIKAMDPSIDVIGQACPLFVPLVEEGWLNSEATYLIARHYLNPLINKGIDTLILGCTHYPLLGKVIQEVVGPSVKLIYSDCVTAEEVKRLLRENNYFRKNLLPPYHKFFVTDDPKEFERIGKTFWGSDDFKAVKVTL